jgi:hypothetical protein
VTDKSHLDEFSESIGDALSKDLVAAFRDAHRDPSLKAADIVTRLKERMEAALRRRDDAAD